MGGKFIYAWRQEGLQVLIFFFSPLSLGFAAINLSILDTCMKSWSFLIAVKLLAVKVECAKDRWIEIRVKHCVLVSAQNMSPSSLSKSIVFLTVCVIFVGLVASFRPQWFVVYCYPCPLFSSWVLGVQILPSRLVFAQLLYSTQFTVNISYLQKNDVRQSLGELTTINLVWVFD